MPDGFLYGGDLLGEGNTHFLRVVVGDKGQDLYWRQPRE